MIHFAKIADSPFKLTFEKSFRPANMLGNILPEPESTTAYSERLLPDKHVTVAHSTPATCLSANYGRISYGQT